jgi:hypothetical protein
VTAALKDREALPRAHAEGDLLLEPGLEQIELSVDASRVALAPVARAANGRDFSAWAWGEKTSD